MKKVIITLALLAFASSAMAVTELGTAGQTLTTGGAVFKTSTSVNLKVIATVTNYAASTQHGSADPAKGGKQYGSTSNESLMLVAPAVATAYPTSPTDATALPAAFVQQ